VCRPPKSESDPSAGVRAVEAQFARLVCALDSLSVGERFCVARYFVAFSVRVVDGSDRGVNQWPPYGAPISRAGVRLGLSLVQGRERRQTLRAKELCIARRPQSAAAERNNRLS
jgi:hypothetical protein